MRDVLRMAQPRITRFLPTVLWGFASASAAVCLLAVSGWLIVSASIVTSLIYLNVAIVGVRFFAVSRAVFRYMERLSGHDAALRQLAVTRAETVRRLVPFSPAGLGHTNRGEVLSTLVDDVDELQNLPLRVVQPLAVGAVVSLGAVIVVSLIDLLAGLSLLICLALAAAAAAFLSGRVGAEAERKIAERRGQLAAAIDDYIGALDVLLAYGAAATARARIDKADAALRQAQLRASLAEATSAAVVSVAAGLASLLAIALSRPDLEPAWLGVVALVPMVVFEVFAVVPITIAAWRRVRGSADRIAHLVPSELPRELRADASSGEPGASEDLGVRPPRIVLREVSAAWPGEADSLRGITLSVEPGERLLIEGSSGAGKSTLAAVLVGFLAARGSYTLDGVESQAISGPRLREIVGLCEQQPQLFDEDIRQNLLFARETASDAELLDVLGRVGLGDWVRSRGGLDARIGERGALVSGGQAQRLSLARAMLRGFPVLVLDEPTAGVDADTADTLLRDLLDATRHGQSIILISHTPPPDGIIDRRVRIEAGREALA